MTQLLERAFNEAAKLTESEQDAVASVLMAELESKGRGTSAEELLPPGIYPVWSPYGCADAVEALQAALDHDAR